MNPRSSLQFVLLFAALCSPLAAFHHTAGEKPKQSARPAAVSFAPEAKSDAGLEKFFQTLATSLHRRDAQPVLALLAPDYTVEGLPANADQSPVQVFGQAIERLNAPEEFVISSVRTAADGPTVKVELQFPNRVVTRSFKFDAQGRLQRTDLFKINARPHGTPPAAAAPPPGGTAVTFAPGVPANPHFAEFLGTLADAIRTGDPAKLTPPRPDFAVTGLDGVRGTDALRQAFGRFGGRLDEITFTGRREGKDGNALLLRFRIGERSWPGELRYDANMALASADLLPPSA